MYKKTIRKISEAFVLNREKTSKKYWALINCNWDEIWLHFLTVDLTRIHHNATETHQQSKQWISPAPKKVKLSRLTDKVIATVFWDERVFIHIDYLKVNKNQ